MTAAVPAPDVDTVLGNGLRVVVVRAPVVPLAEIRLTVPHAPVTAGDVSRWQVLAACLLHGTREHDAASFDAALAGCGATLTATADARRLTVAGHTLAERLPDVLRLLADAVLRPDLDDALVARRTGQTAHRLRLAADQPAAVAQDALLRHRYGERAALWQPAPDGLGGCDAASLRALHRRHVRAGGASLVLAGDVRPDEALHQVTRTLGGWRAAEGEVRQVPPPPFGGGPLRLVRRPGAVQSLLRLAAPAVPRTDPDYPALHLAHVAFGGSFSSRLARRLREEKGYAYLVASGMESVPGSSALMVEADTATEHTAAALACVREELERMCEQPPDTAEVRSAQRYAAGSTATAMAAPAALATALSNLLHVGAGADWLHRWEDRLTAVRPAEVAAAARRFFAPEGFTGVVVAESAAVDRMVRASPSPGFAVVPDPVGAV